MTSAATIVLERVAHSDREVMRIRVEAVQGEFSGAVEIWTSTYAVRAVGEALRAFPAKLPDKYEYYFEGESQNLQVDAQTTDRTGHCTLRLSFLVQDSQWSFRNVVDPAALHRLGELFISLTDHDLVRVSWPSSEPTGETS